MAPQGSSATSATRTPRIMACQRCRHRKQKCTEPRPCENCVQSGSECIPAEATVSRPAPEQGYVHRLEQRVAQLEAQIPNENTDHMDRQLHMDQPMTMDAQETASSNQDSSPQSYHHSGSFQMPGIFGTLSGLHPPPTPVVQDDLSQDGLELGGQVQQFLIQTYFEMAHTQYPFLLKQEFLQWADSWNAHKDSLPSRLWWKGFFVNMVIAVGLLMNKARIGGPNQPQMFFGIATSKYLPALTSCPNPVTRAQGYLLLAIYALHMPSTEQIISLSAWTMRFCVMAQLHVAGAEPEAISSDAWIQIQMRRRVFWCAYALDRAVCSTYDLPCNIPDSHITTSVYENISDDDLVAAASSFDRETLPPEHTSLTLVSPALHILDCRKIESEIQEMTLRRDFLGHSAESFVWRSTVLEALKKWNVRSKLFADPSQRGYVSLRWLSMIYHYNLVMLYRPTREVVEGMAGDWSVQACCQALLLFRKFQAAREIAQPWLGLITQFQIGVTLLYCFWATPPKLWKESYRSADASDAIRACSSTLAILAERWIEADCLRDVFEVLAREVPLGASWPRPQRMSSTSVTSVEANMDATRRLVIHRPIMRMIEEMTYEDFPVNPEDDYVTTEPAYNVVDASAADGNANLNHWMSTNRLVEMNFSSADYPAFPDDIYFD